MPKQKFTREEMKERAVESRKQFALEISKLPKMPPGKVILLVGWALVMSALDNTIVNIANPNILVDPSFVPPGEEIPTSTIQWINDIYSIAFASFAIPAAKVGDRFGQTVVQRYAVVGFVTFSVLCGCSKYIHY